MLVFQFHNEPPLLSWACYQNTTVYIHSTNLMEPFSLCLCVCVCVCVCVGCGGWGSGTAAKGVGPAEEGGAEGAGKGMCSQLCLLDSDETLITE